LRNAKADFSAVATAVLSADRAIPHSSVEMCDWIQYRRWLDPIATSVLTVHKVVNAFEAHARRLGDFFDSLVSDGRTKTSCNKRPNEQHTGNPGAEQA
jgi:hypothetical protein